VPSTLPAEPRPAFLRSAVRAHAAAAP